MHWEGDPQGGRTFLSDRWSRFTGRPDADERGLGWLDGLSPEDRRRYLEELAAATADSRPLRMCYRLQTADLQTRVVLDEAQPILGAEGRVRSFRGVALDATPVVDVLQAPPEPAPALSLQLEAVREEERSRLARELHDELGQLLTSTKLDLMWLCEQVRTQDPRPSLGLVNKLQSLAGLVELGIATVQQITTNLKPAILDHLGLGAALEWESTTFEARTGIRCRVSSRVGDTLPKGPCAAALFRVTREALTNVARHANAGAVRIDLRQGKDRLYLDVKDNGRGISESEIASTQSLGLIGMRERVHMLGGRLQISGAAGRGTRVSVEVPYPAEERGAP